MTPTTPDAGGQRMHAQGEWILVETFQGAGSVHSLIAYGDAPSIQPGDNGFQSLRRLKHPSGVIRRLITSPVDRAVRTKVGDATQIVHEGTTLHSITDPVVSGTGNVHAAWVWIGESKTPTYEHVLTGAWEWNLRDTSTIHIIYGPNIPQIYGRDWSVGEPYPVHTTTDTIWVNDMTAVAHLLESGEPGARITLEGTTRRPPSPRNEHPISVSIRAATEIVAMPEGRVWRGVTWDVTAFEPPQPNPHHVVASRLAREAEGWTAIVYWLQSWAAEPDKFPIQIVRWEGQKVLDGLWIDPATGRAKVHPDDRGSPHRWAQTLEETGELAAELRLLGINETWRWFNLYFDRIEGSQPPAATVRIVEDPARAVDAARDDTVT